ncbi:CHRD domain-containing protein [Hymenobacter psychrophilus]|uniref:Por secretion system C-terminal sorting domain-containing protein n=1 Tax=Hymenobacter psychrophilus TaxID=651662 RepID=A0A1H3NL49_9BACT|nr:CHRD domain-containing protein [Hymenobacter psychrophilus]SDY89483.1 Por secretion system C-terminal sorting domain-containing protein [Hymenobacter psychrophilus]
MLRTVTYATLSLLLSLLLRPFAVQADHLRAHLLLGAQLSGAQEVPTVTTSARGTASFTLNAGKDTLFIAGSFTGLSGPITAAHVHNGFEGVSGPVVTNVLSMIRGNQIDGFLTGTDLTSAKLDRYLRGAYYLNIHTAANLNGEIRGQIKLEKDEEYAAELTGAKEVPAVNTPATGYGTFNLAQQQNKLTFRVVFSGLSGPVTVTHFHTGAAGTSGPVIVDLKPFLTGNVIEGEITPSAAFLSALAAGQIYINVHTAANGGGEIRSQLIREARFLSHDARLDASQLVPATASAGKGVAVFQLNTTLDTVFLSVAHTGLSGPPTALGVFAANAGVANPGLGVVASAALPANAPNTLQFFITPLSKQTVNLFLTGGANIILATAANPNGEIRGQVYRLAREGYTFVLSGKQERPNPVAGTGYGAGFVSMDRDQSNVHLNMTWGGLSGPAIGGHFHPGLSNETGTVVFNLMPFFNATTPPSGADAYWNATNDAPNATNPFTAKRALQFRRDSVYVNLHTTANPGGEIRGQVLRGARSLSVLLAAKPSALVAEGFAAVPNPFRDALSFSFEARSSGAGTLRVTDLLGRTVATQTVNVRPGTNRTEVQVPGAAGVYVLELELNDSRIVSRITKQ